MPPETDRTQERSNPHPPASGGARGVPRATLAVVALGVSLRLVLLLLVEPLETWADEGQYLYQALAWNRFGVYLGSEQWLWPPGYPGLLAVGLALFGSHGVLAVKLFQVLCSAVVGGSVVWLARRLFDARAALVAALLWAGYLPLIVFTHTLWPETPFLALLLPAVALFLAGVEAPRPAPLRLAAAGALIGAGLYFKEAPLPLCALLPLIVLAARRERWPDRLGLAVLPALAAAAVLLPWSLRVQEVHGRAVPSGATLGENAWQGVNADYVNYDYAGRPALANVARDGPTYRWFVRWPAEAEKWARAEDANTIARNAANVARAKSFAREHPGFFLRSRVKKLADWVTPLNFFQRHVRLDLYHGPVARVGGPLALVSVALTLLVLAASVGGLFLRLPNGPRRWTFLAVLLTFLGGVLIVSMSRYRVPAEPFLLVLASGFLARPRTPAAVPVTRASRVGALGTWFLLLALWALNAAEVWRMLKETL